MTQQETTSEAIEASTREIIEVTYQYGRGMDDRDWAAFANAFTESAHANFNDHYIVDGRQAITDLIRPIIEACSLTHHMMTNHIVQMDGDRADMKLLCRAFHTGSGRYADQTYECLVRYVAKMRRSESRWQIADWYETVVYEWGTQDILNP